MNTFKIIVFVLKNYIHHFLIVAANQPNIHPGSITSTGRQRVGSSTATSTQQAQLIGGGISPTLFTSPVSSSNLRKLWFICF